MQFPEPIPIIFKEPVQSDLPYPLWELYFEYRCPVFGSGDTFVDIGANIGDSCLMANMKGAGKVIGFEPSLRSYESAIINTKNYPNIKIFNKAVWRSDTQQKLMYLKDEEGYLTLNMTKSEGDTPIETISLDEIIYQYSPIRFLKIDCEGSEFPILLTSKLLPMVRQIGMEVHIIPQPQLNSPLIADMDRSKFNLEDLNEFLKSRGFDSKFEKTGDPGLGFIYATHV